MIYRLNYVVTAIIAAAFIIATALVGRRGSISGTEKPAIVSASTGAAVAFAATIDPPSAPAPAYAEVSVALDETARKSLPLGDVLLVHVVKSSSYTIVVDKPYVVKPLPTPAPAPKPRHRPSWFGFNKEEQAAAPAAPPAPTPTAVPVAAPPPAVLAAPPPIIAVSAMTFNELDGALRSDARTQALNQRSTKGRVTLRVTLAGKVSNRAAVALAIANSESNPFFISLIKVAVNGATIPSESVGPYVANPGQEIQDIVHFDGSAVAGKTVTITLIQSGGDHRQFQMTPEHTF